MVQVRTVQARAAVLRQTNAPMTIETIEVGPLAPGDVLVRVRAASLCHTDLEAIEGQLPVKLPAVLGHEAAGEVVAVGEDVADLGVGDRVVLSWNPHCGHCFYCERAQPILCAQFLANGPQAFHFDGKPRLSCDAVPVHQLSCISAASRSIAWCRRRARSACLKRCRSTARRCSAAA
jgi:S-(hydroxymethyl)glutathione dehydrogenase / alcohol dehydrogenase